uniref:Uncharacterized protein n=1 Tax=Ditylenchus dipsaci TaxID=166011 RepID=A0A915DI83_9BILA
MTRGPEAIAQFLPQSYRKRSEDSCILTVAAKQFRGLMSMRIGSNTEEEKVQSALKVHEATVDDFWRSGIVAGKVKSYHHAVRNHGAGRNKCEAYWPTDKIRRSAQAGADHQ